MRTKGEGWALDQRGRGPASGRGGYRKPARVQAGGRNENTELLAAAVTHKVPSGADAMPTLA